MYVKLFEGKGPIIPIVVVTVVGGINHFWGLWKTDVIAQYEKSVLILSFFLTAVLLYSIGKTITVATSRVFLDPETGEQVIFKQRHTFLGGSSDTWAYVIGGLSVYTLGHAIFTGTLFTV